MGRRRKSLRTIAVVLAFAMAQAYTQLNFAVSAAPTSPTFPPQQMLARLTTKGNLPITVNGISASSGDTITTEATIETPANVNATVDLGPLGSLDIEPGAKIKLEFEGNCNPAAPGDSGAQDPLQKCTVKVTIYAGCVAAHHKKGSYFQVVTEQQMLLKDSDKSKKRAGGFQVCFGGAAGAAAAPTGLTTITKVLIAALVIGGGGIVWWALDDNPSPSGT